MEWVHSREEILQISHDAMGQNCATWLTSRRCLSKMSLPSLFLGISSEPTEYYRKETDCFMTILFLTEKKIREKRFRRACLSGKFMSLHMLVFNEIESYMKGLFFYLPCK